MIRVVVAEDSPTARRLLVELLASDPEISVVGEAATGREAVALAEQLHPTLITMDVNMPELDGLEATRQIMGRVPTPIIVVSSRANETELELSLEATRAGALMVLPKPEGPQSPRFREQRDQLVAMVKAMAQVKVVRRWRGAMASPAVPTPVTAPPAGGRGSADSPRVLAIGASTGGPAALRELLAELPGSLRVPVLVVQHISPGFISGLAHWLDSGTALRVKVAEMGEEARAGTVYLAPDDRHLGIRDDFRIVLSSEPPVGAFRPSATHLFRSVAEAFSGAVVAVILTGMGDDGVEGLRAVRSARGFIIAQDESTSVVYGMPREAARAGVVDAILPLHAMPRRLIAAVG